MISHSWGLWLNVQLNFSEAFVSHNLFYIFLGVWKWECLFICLLEDKKKKIFTSMFYFQESYLTKQIFAHAKGWIS